MLRKLDKYVSAGFLLHNIRFLSGSVVRGFTAEAVSVFYDLLLLKTLKITAWSNPDRGEPPDATQQPRTDHALMKGNFIIGENVHPIRSIHYDHILILISTNNWIHLY